MASDLDQAVWAFEEAVESLVLFVKGASYGLRLASKKLGDLASSGPSKLGSAPGTQAEMEALLEALGHGEDRLSDVVVLALGDHLRAFLARALELPSLPHLPGTPVEVEVLAGTPNALLKSSPLFALLLQLYRVSLKGGALDREAMEALGKREIELSYPGGKVKLFRAGDRVTLSEQQLEAMGKAAVEAARAVYLRLMTA